MRSALSFLGFVLACFSGVSAFATNPNHRATQTLFSNGHLTTQEQADQPAVACLGLYRYKNGDTNHYVEFHKDGTCAMDFGGEKVSRKSCTFKQEKYEVTVTNQVTPDKSSRVVWNFLKECVELDIGGRVLKLEKADPK